jgi:aspartyl-tRNA(Asn)/glutamyl-tRNA(Gln) amidotransferase subunit B
MQWETVIGLEVHIQLNTQSKIFSAASTAFGAPPNTQACAIDLGMPGVLPVLNQACLDKALLFGLAIDAELPQQSFFARKNYFYPDLPKGYQISQMDQPIVGRGSLTITLDQGETKTIGITRAHLEEDAGKSLHEDFHGMTGIDLNRAGTPLLEIVSEPELRSASEAVAYLKALHALVRYLDISDGNMAQGSMRCDANVSIRPQGSDQLGTRTEIKNVNSFRFVEKAINYEVQRQINRVEAGQRVVQETRLYDATKHETRSMRLKEEANDYRYFPDPDLLPVTFTEQSIARLKTQLPELPKQKQQRFQQDYQLTAYDAQILSASRELADYFEQVVKLTQDAKLSANWVMGELAAWLNKDNLTIEQSPISPEQLAGLLKRIKDRTISGKIAKTLFVALCQGEGDSADQLIAEQDLQQVTDQGAIEQLIDQVLTANPKQLDQYRSGKDKLFGFFVGQVMKASQGKANPAQVNQLLRDKLNHSA